MRGRLQRIALLCAALVGAGVLSLYGLELSIHHTAIRTAESAVREFGGSDRIDALIQLVSCTRCDLRQRNRAVWALGELEDPRALPVLEQFHTGAKCDHGRELCQYELDKATQKIRGTWGALPYIHRIRGR